MERQHVSANPTPENFQSKHPKPENFQSENNSSDIPNRDTGVSPRPLRQTRHGQRLVMFYPESETLVIETGFQDGHPKVRQHSSLPGRTDHPVYEMGPNLKVMWKSCLRGGWLSLFNRRTYFGTKRFRREIESSDLLRRHQIPTSHIHAISLTPGLLGYRVEMLIQLEPGVCSVQELLEDSSGEHMESDRVAAIARQIHAFHELGFLHGDLNLMNILVNKSAHSPTKVLLVDLDPGGLSPGEDRISNLARLCRSYAKVLSKGGTALASGDRFRFLYHATGGNKSLLRKAIAQCISKVPEKERCR